MNDSPDIGEFRLALTPEAECRFAASPAVSVHAALLRRLETVDPDLSRALHDAPSSAASSDHPWTVSPVSGPLRPDRGALVAQPDDVYRVRIGVLAPHVAKALALAFDPAIALAAEPLVLENVPFHLVPIESPWTAHATYPGLVAAARPLGRISLTFSSPTAFRTARDYGLDPPPKLCVWSWLRRWNAFSNVAMPQEVLLEHAERYLRVVETRLRPGTTRLHNRSVTGVVGTVVWQDDGGPPSLLKWVNALVDYARYCGTGVSTAQGMGQTRRSGEHHSH